MKLEKKIYETDQEKRRDFWIGFGGWFGINIPLAVLMLFIPLFGLLSLLINLGGLIVLAFTRSRIALGALAAIGAALVLTLCAGLIFLAACLVMEGS